MSSYLRHVTVLKKQALAAEDVLYDMDRYVEKELQAVSRLPADQVRARSGAAAREGGRQRMAAVEAEERAADEKCGEPRQTMRYSATALEKANTTGTAVTRVIDASNRRTAAAEATLSGAHRRTKLHPIDVIQAKIRGELERELQDDVLVRHRRKYARPVKINEELEHILANTVSRTTALPAIP